MAPSRKAHRLFIMLMPLFLAGIVLDTGSEDIYKTISKDGTIQFSDKAPLDNSPAEIVTLKNNNSVPAVRPIRKIQQLNEKKTLSAKVEIVTPTHVINRRSWHLRSSYNACKKGYLNYIYIYIYIMLLLCSVKKS